MVPYQLNMARGFVMPLESRRKWLRWFFAYVAVMAVAITLTLLDVIRDSSSWQSQLAALEQRERRVLAGQPDFKSVKEYHAQLDQRIAQNVRDLDAVLAFGKRNTPVGRILLGLAEPLPAGVELNRVSFDGDAGTLSVDVVMPTDSKGHETLTPPNLVSMWEKAPLLAGKLSQITVETSERVKVNGMNVVSWRFSAIVEGH